LAAALAAATAVAASGCGGGSGDLLAVEVEGTRLVVTNDGRGRCDGGDLVRISSDDLIAAREIERGLLDEAHDGRSFGGDRPGRRRYVLRIRAGTVRWAEGARGLPPELPRAQLLSLRLERTLCRG
jgi:hypothetical protein